VADYLVVEGLRKSFGPEAAVASCVSIPEDPATTAISPGIGTATSA
jgi:hypothetical protein